VVSLAQPGKDDLPIDPLGAATLRQRVCPLNVKLQRFGAMQALGPANFVLDEVVLNKTTLDKTKIPLVDESFAPAQFFQMSDSQKLSSPAFQKLKGGLTVAPNEKNLASGSGETNEVKYTTKVIGDPGQTEEPLAAEHLGGMWKRSVTGLGGLRRLGAEAYLDPTAKPKFVVADELFVVAEIQTLTTRKDVLAAPLSKIEATFALHKHLASDPTARATLQVVPKFEMAGR
jgi:hypothetical protein